MKLVLSILLLIFNLTVFAANKFGTDYVSFDLLANWHCMPEGQEYICTDKLNPKKINEAIIILTAKEKGPMDSLNQYQAHLKRTRTIRSADGRSSVQSKIFHSKQRTIHGHMWVDGFQSDSEVANFYTRYLVTTKEQLAVIVTYSAHKKHYKKYAADFAKSIASLRLKNVKWSARKVGALGLGGADEDIFGGLGRGMGDGSGEGDIGAQDQDILTLLKQNWPVPLLLLLALAAYVFLKRKRKAKQRRESRSARDRHHRHRRRSSSRHSSRH